ncbi:zinc ribbon domain-containing protein [Cupriavidus sp. IDO]|uniref:zinc ribbon domain-containing protein n=1 Tax=Cupriavidus sp. IDO TaxID=1539142 RepID=UPI003FCCB35D
MTAIQVAAQGGNPSYRLMQRRHRVRQNVRAKSGLNKSILDQGWFEFRRQLGYKLAWNGGWLIAVSPQNTSRTCPRLRLRVSGQPADASPVRVRGM